ncbi:MAG: tyrosine-protein phosphatase [Candidatus Limnocylindria bacterium]
MGGSHHDWEGCFNIRDLGGLPTRGGRATAHSAFLRGDSVCRLTDRGRQAVREDGVRTIVDLRRASELQRDPNPFANVPEEIAFLHLPFSDDAIEARVRDIPTGAERYRVMLDDGRQRVARIMTALATAERAVLFHCYVGRDRTGMVAAMLLRLAGVPDEEIVRDYVLTDERMAPLYEEWRTEMDDERRARFDRAIAEEGAPIEAALRHLDDRYGGVEAYLLGGGVSADSIVALTEALVR